LKLTVIRNPTRYYRQDTGLKQRSEMPASSVILVRSESDRDTLLPALWLVIS
jgi:hypothetical protein